MYSRAFTGGLRVGDSYWNSSNFTWPLATLRFFDDQIKITGVFGDIRLMRDQITNVSEYRGLISDGIQIKHTSPNQQPFIVFWIKPDAVNDAFHQFGFELQSMPDDGRVARLRARFSMPRFVAFFLLLFALLLMNELHRPQSPPDAFLNAIALTVFAAAVAWFLRRRLIR